MGFIRRGFIWDIPILIFAYVLFSGSQLWYLHTAVIVPVRCRAQVFRFKVGGSEPVGHDLVASGIDWFGAQDVA